MPDSVIVQMACIALLSPLFCTHSTLLVIQCVAITRVLTIVRVSLYELLSSFNCNVFVTS